MSERVLNDDVNSGNYDFFISFSMADLEIVRKIVEDMENLYHVKCWFQVKDSKAEFVGAIMNGIEKAKAFLVFVSPNSAASNFVLDEVHYATQWSQSHEDYKILPIVIDREDSELSQPVYKVIKFYLARLNMLFYEGSNSVDALILKIFEQTGYNIIDDAFRTSLYHYAENESVRLKAQNEIMLDFSKELFEKIVKPGSMILDVGCAGGDHITSQLENLPYSDLLGVDIDEAQIERANNEYGSQKNKFLCCDVLSDDFEEVIFDYLEDHDARAFDLITISAMLLHIAEPVRLLRTLKRYLRKDGFLVIQDEDDGANVVHPYSRFFDLAFRIWADSKESGDRYCARKIPGYLKEAGYNRVKLAKCGIANVGMSEAQKSAFWDIYFNHYLWIADDENMFYHSSSTMQLLNEYKDIYEKYKEQYDNGDIFVQLGFYLYIAQR